MVASCQGDCQGCCQGDVLQMLCRLSGRVQAAARGLRGHPGAQRDLAEAQELLREARNARAVSTPTAHTQQRPVGACVPQDRPETLPKPQHCT